MKRRIIYLAIIFFLCTYNISCSKSDSSSGGNNPPPTGTTATINIVGMTFSQASVTVKTGTKVKWTNTDTMAHTATSDDGSTFNTGSIAAGSSATITVSTTGTFPYHCSFHSNMIATLVVIN